MASEPSETHHTGRKRRPPWTERCTTWGKKSTRSGQENGRPSEEELAQPRPWCRHPLSRHLQDEPPAPAQVRAICTPHLIAEAHRLPSSQGQQVRPRGLPRAPPRVTSRPAHSCNHPGLPGGTAARLSLGTSRSTLPHRTSAPSTGQVPTRGPGTHPPQTVGRTTVPSKSGEQLSCEQGRGTTWTGKRGLVTQARPTRKSTHPYPMPNLRLEAAVSESQHGRTVRGGLLGGGRGTGCRPGCRRAGVQLSTTRVTAPREHHLKTPHKPVPRGQTTTHGTSLPETRSESRKSDKS